MNAIVYGLGTLGRDALAILVSMYLMFYLTEVRGIGGAQLAALTAIMVAMRVFDALNDPLMGMVVDNTRTRWGKFKPWIAAGALAWAVAGVAMFADWPATGWAYVAVFAACYLAFEISYTVNDISYWGMLPSLSRDQKERERIGSVARICASIGTFSVVVGIVPVTGFLTERLGDARSAWAAVAVGVVVAMLAFQVLAFFARERVAVDTGRVTWREAWRAIAGNDQLMWTMLGMTLFMAGYTATTSLGLYYFTYVLGDAGAYALFALMLGVTQIVTLALFPLIASRVRRFRIHLIATAFVCAGYALMLAAGGALPVVLAAGVLLFAGQAAIQVLLVMFVADSVEYGQWKLGHRTESLTFAIQPFIYKLSNGLATAAVGATLIVAGIGGTGNAGGAAVSAAQANPELVGSAQVTVPISVTMLAVPLVLAVISYLVLRAKYRLDEATYAGIIADLRAREAADANSRHGLG